MSGEQDLSFAQLRHSPDFMRLVNQCVDKLTEIIPEDVLELFDAADITLQDIIESVIETIWKGP